MFDLRALRIFLIIFLIICFMGCGKGQSQNDTALYHPFSFKMEYPITIKGKPSQLYSDIQKESFTLKLESIQAGYDSVQIRVWFANSSDSLNRTIVIKTKDGKYVASLISYKVLEDGTMASVASKELFPKSGWQTLMNTLTDLKIFSLSHMSDIPGFKVAWADGELYAVELATRNQYRFYYYWCPEILEGKYWQASNMKKILETFNSEFGVELYKACE